MDKIKSQIEGKATIIFGGKFTYEMTKEERQEYIKKKGTEKAQTKYKNMFKLIGNLRSVK